MRALKKIVKEGFFDTFIVWRDEFRNIFSDAGVVIFFVVAPLFYPLLYAFMYDEEVAKEVKMVVVDNDKSSKSREFRRLCDASRDVFVAGECANMAEAKEKLRRKEAYGIMVIPKDFHKDIVRGEKCFVQLYADMSSLLYYKAFLLTLTEVSLEMGADIQTAKISSATEREQDVTVAPIEYENVTFFNPKSGFASFLIPGVLMLIIQQMLLLGVGLLSGGARDRNAYRNLFPIQRHYSGTLRIVFGKTLCYMMIFSVLAVYLAWFIPKIFRLPQMGDGLSIFLFMLPYLLACCFFAMTVTAFVKDRESPFVLFVFTSIILLFVSGISWPSSAIPWYWKSFSYLFPSTFGIQGFVKLNTMGALLSDLKLEFLGLWIQAGVYFVLACLVYRWQIKCSWNKK